MGRISSAGTEDVHEKSIRLLTKSLYSLRKPESSDVILVCSGKEIFAHKLILQACSPYFQTLFSNNGKDEGSHNGRVFFKDVELETMDAVLDFVYLGSVEKVKTADQFQKVLHVARMMELAELVQYCRDALGEVKSGTYFETNFKTDLEKKINAPAVNAEELDKNMQLSESSSGSSSDLTASTVSFSDLSNDSNAPGDAPLENWPLLPISGAPNRGYGYKTIPGLIASWLLLFFDGASRNLYRRPRLELWVDRILALVCLVSVVLVLRTIWHPTFQNDFSYDLLSCVNSEPEIQYGCIKTMLRRHPPTNSLNSRSFRMPGTGLLHFGFHKSSQAENELHGMQPQFTWKLTYYSDYRNIRSPRLGFCESWFGKLLCRDSNNE